MSIDSGTRPVWCALRPSVHAIRVAVGESPEWIATRTEAFLSQLQARFEVASWVTHEGRPWAGSIVELSNFVRRNVVRGRPTSEDPKGEALSIEGYSFIVSGSGPRVGFQIRVAAGAGVVGRRLPTHTLLVQFNSTADGGVTSELGDAVCVDVSTIWKPSMLVLSDDPVRQMARRGGWKIGVGYRTWISAEVGEISTVAAGLVVSELAGGTLVTAPDAWPAERVVTAMTETLSVNGLDEVPH